MDDVELADALRRTAAGDRAALRQVYEATSAKLFGVVLRILTERAEAEDVLQSVYLTVWQRAASYDPARASPTTWLVTIARNRAIDRLRARPRATVDIEAANDIADPAPIASEVAAAASDARALDGCIGELGAQQALAIRAAYFEGLTHEALATRMAVPLGTVKSWIRRSLQRLRECLER
jgi:RNA polymerase sigma-70 factor (ECF subfamily)